MENRTGHRRYQIRHRGRMIIKIWIIVNIIWTVTLIFCSASTEGRDNSEGDILDRNNKVVSKENSAGKEPEKQTAERENKEINSFVNEYASKSDKCRNFKVCIDAGHGGKDIGAEGVDGQYEKEETLALSLLVKKYLEQAGVKVYMTRENDKTLSLSERRKAAEECRADIFISIHRNMYEGTEDVNGIEAWVSNTRPEEAVRFANEILECVTEQVPGVSNRGVKYGTMDNVKENYGINKVSMTSLILETGFISSRYDNELFTNYMDKYAEGIVRGILNNI